MKILHVTQGYFPAIGGTELLVQRVSEEMVRQFGDEVTVFTTNAYSGEAFFTPGLPLMPTGWESLNGVKIRRFPVRTEVSHFFRGFQAWAYHLGLPGNQHLRNLAGGPVIPNLEKEIQDFPFDVVAASSFPLMHMFASLRAAQATSRPCVLHGGMHPEDRWGFDRPMIDQALRETTRYISNTDYEARYVLSRGADPSRVCTVGVGVDLENYQEITQEDARRKLDLGEGPLIGFVGQVGGHKGVDTLVRSMKTVWEVLPEAHLLIAGARTLFHPKLEALLSEMTNEQRSKIHLRYNFPVEEKPWLFSAVDVFAYPSGFESFGIAYLEAWACYKPVIGCWRGAIPSVISAGKDGLLVPFQDDKALGEAILMLLKNPGWARAMGEAGHRKVVERYTWERVGQRFRQIYIDALEEQKETPG